MDPALNFPSRAIVTKAKLHLSDWATIELPEHERGIQALFGVNASLMLPLLRDDECIGVLAFARKQPRAFSDRETALAESFRDQALIAIQNTRLFNETKEALERQTATAEVLQVVSSSMADARPVFDAHPGQRRAADRVPARGVFLVRATAAPECAANRGPDADVIRRPVPDAARARLRRTWCYSIARQICHVDIERGRGAEQCATWSPRSEATSPSPSRR